MKEEVTSLAENKPAKNTGKIVGLIAAGAAICIVSFVAGAHFNRWHNEPMQFKGDGMLRGGPRFGGLRHHGLMGKVSAISSGSITIDGPQGGTTTFEITSDTKFSKDSQTAKVTDIKNGDTVLIRPNSSNTKQASLIILSPSDFTPTSATDQQPAENSITN